MEAPVYTLTNNTEIFPELNKVVRYDAGGNAETHELEPRQMKVLEILLAESPRVVTREELIDRVWNNYGGADDALNQVISHLRKILDDSKKDHRIIETVVKKGYRVTQLKNAVPQQAVPAKKINIYALLAGLLLLVCIALIVVQATRKDAEAPAPEAPAPDQKLPPGKESPAPEAG